MSSQSELIRRELMERDPEFRRLFEEHARYSGELEALDREPRRTPEDELRIAELKKRKLQAKDRMEEWIRNYRRGEAEAVEAT